MPFGWQPPPSKIPQERRDIPLQAPHRPLRSYYPSERDRSAWVRGIFDRTAADYDRLERILGLGSGPWYRRRALRHAGLEAGMSVIDVGTGTGLLACAAASIVGDPARVTGVDPSPGMIEHARVPAGVRLLSGSAERIPAPDGAADFLSLGYALRHISDLTVAFAEFYRVLRPGGRLCVLEITLPVGTVRRALLKAWLNGLVPRIAAVIARRRDAPLLMHYNWDTIAACVPPQAILGAIGGAGFVDVERHVDLAIFSAYHARKPLASEPRAVAC
jgi:demethylmenaquinone methyltransferase / 2-methoxy-6-polyprenyl-1,4-benzoquinol methylase